jgi:hypothetical protein
VATCFVIMPISTPKSAVDTYKDPDHFTHVLQYLFKPALENAGYQVIPPATVGADVIQASIVRNLEEADLVLCDISTLNPNVFFELGIRTSLDHPVALVRDNLTPHIPFDTSSINTHTYDASLALWSVAAEISKLSSYVTEATAQATGGNSMWRVFGITQRARPAEIENPTEAKLDLLMAQVTQLAKQIEAGPFVSYTTVSGTGSVVYGGSFPVTSSTVFDTNMAPYTLSTAMSQTAPQLINPVPSRFDDFIERAKAIAATESAALTVDGYDTVDDTVVLSSGGWRLSSENTKKIGRLAGAQRIKVRLIMEPR